MKINTTLSLFLILILGCRPEHSPCPEGKNTYYNILYRNNIPYYHSIKKVSFIDTASQKIVDLEFTGIDSNYEKVSLMGNPDCPNDFNYYQWHNYKNATSNGMLLNIAITNYRKYFDNLDLILIKINNIPFYFDNYYFDNKSLPFYHSTISLNGIIYTDVYSCPKYNYGPIGDTTKKVFYNNSSGILAIKLNDQWWFKN